MSKKRSDIYNFAGVDPVAEVSKHLSKKGKLKGEKKQIKALKSICAHHALNRKGKVKARIHQEGNKMCQCDLCKDRFKSGFYSDQEMDQAYNSFKPQISQAKLLAQATGAGEETVRELSILNLAVDRSRKTMRNLRNVAQKQDKVKKKKKQKTRSSDLGGWGSSR